MLFYQCHVKHFNKHSHLCLDQHALEKKRRETAELEAAKVKAELESIKTKHTVPAGSTSKPSNPHHAAIPVHKAAVDHVATHDEKATHNAPGVHVPDVRAFLTRLGYSQVSLV